MPLFGAIFGVVFRSLGRIVTFLFGWAIIRFFGEMPSMKKYLLSSIALLSVAWWYFVVSLIWPPVFTLLVRIQPQAARETGLINWVTWPAILAIPLLTGVLTMFVDEKPKPGIWGKLRPVLQGYLVAPGFGIAILTMMLVSTGLVIYSTIRQMKVEHVPILLKPDGYQQVLMDLTKALEQSGYKITRHPTPWVLKPPEWILAVFASNIFKGVAPKEACILSGDCDMLNVVIHTADIAVSAQKETAVRARAVITTNVPFTEAYLTWDKGSRAFEDRVAAIRKRYLGKGPQAIPQAQQEIEQLKASIYVKGVPFQQWEVLYREVLQLEEALIVTPVQQTNVEHIRQQAEDELRKTEGRAVSLRQLRSSFAVLTEIMLGLFGYIRRRRRHA